jgi:hypothetical protein
MPLRKFLEILNSHGIQRFQHSSKLDIHLRDEDKKQTVQGKLFLDRQPGVFPSVDAVVEMINGLEIVLLKYLQRAGAAAP